ncbi:MAG TPA: hypothetical protein VK653_12325, partial [Xanthobacteraceae bacterium]|nr:hypothetical protein [Xanthobacteraceae bacterium]
EKSQPKTGGRVKGTKNRLSTVFLNDLLADYEAHGAETIKICRVERPVEYIKMIAGLLPRELEITETYLMEMPDDELNAVIEHVRRQIAERAIELRSRGESTTIN